jgi:hypothetical protein
VADIIGELVFLALSLVLTFFGALALRDVARGKAQTLSRMSTRVFDRREEPFNFWTTVATQMGWGLTGLFFLCLTLGGMLRLL